MSLAGHCSGLYQTIRDEGVDMSGRGALNFLGGLVALVDDSANDETEVHIGKQPDLTDLFVTADAAPHLTIGGAGKRTRVRDDLVADGRLGVGSSAGVSGNLRASMVTWPALGAGAAIMLQMSLAGNQTANGLNRKGFNFVGLYDLAGFALTDFIGIAATPTLDDGVGTGLLVTYSAVQAGIDCRPSLVTPDASAYDALAPGVSTQATRGHGYRARNQGNVNIVTGFGFRAEELRTSPQCRPFQDEGSDVGDPHGNRHRSNTQFGSVIGSFAGGDGVIGIADATTLATGTPAGGGVLESQGGYLKWVDSGGRKARISPVEVGFVAVNGNNNDIAIGEATHLVISGPTAAFTLTGIAGGAAARVLYIHNGTAQNMTLSHEDALSVAANRLHLVGGGSVTSVGECTAMFVYEAATSRWTCLGFLA